MISDPSDVFAAKSTDRGVLSYLKTDPATMALGTLLITNVLAILMMNAVLDSLRDPSWDTPLSRLYATIHIGAEGSVAESFNHGMAFAAAMLFFLAGRAGGSRSCIVMAALMAMAWFDDSAQYHERFSKFFAEGFPGLSLVGLGAVDIGGLLAWASIGTVLLGLSLWALCHVQEGDRLVVRMVLVPIVILIFCASIIDVLHALAMGTKLDKMFLYLEDGGEMLSIAMLATIAAFLARNAANIFGTGNGRIARL